MEIPPSISITIPIYNEETVLNNTALKLLADLESSGLTFEVILAENGSTDLTLKVAEKLARDHRQVRVIHLSSPNYGQAMQQGFLASDAEFLTNFSIDFWDMEFLRDALAKIDRFDMILGSKYISRGYDRRPLTRRIGGLLLSRFVRLVFGLPISDTHGLLVLRGDRVRSLIGRCRFGHEIFDTELIVRSYQAGCRVCEMPVCVQEQRSSRAGTIKRALRMLVELTKLRLVLWQEGIHPAANA